MKLNIILLSLFILAILPSIATASESTTTLPLGPCDEGVIQCNPHGNEIIICRNNSWDYLKFCDRACLYNNDEAYCEEYQTVLASKIINEYTNFLSLFFYFSIALLFFFARRNNKNHAFKGLVIGLIIGYFVGVFIMLSLSLMLFGIDPLISGISSGYIVELILPNLSIVAISGAIGSLIGARKKK